MSTKSLIRVARKLFAEEPRIIRVESSLGPDLWPQVGVDFTFVVDADSRDTDRNIASLVTRFMLEADVGAEFVVLPEQASPEARGGLVYSREPTAPSEP